jgi:hypothetical protein
LPVDEHGFPVFEGKPIGSQFYGGRYTGQVSHAAGMYQWQPATWRDAVAAMAKDGIQIKDFSPQSQEQVATYMLEHEGLNKAWLPFNDRLAAAYNQYKQSGQEPRFVGPLAYWEQGYTGAPGGAGGGGGGGVGGTTSTGGSGRPGDPATFTTNVTGGQGGGQQGVSPQDIIARGAVDAARFRRLALFQAAAQAINAMKSKPVQSGYDPSRARSFDIPDEGAGVNRFKTAGSEAKQIPTGPVRYERTPPIAVGRINEGF